MKLHLTSLAILLATGALAHAALIAHYDFDTVETSDGVSTTKEVTSGGTNFATGGSRAIFDQSSRRLGTGSLVLKNRGGTEVPPATTARFPAIRSTGVARMSGPSPSG